MKEKAKEAFFFLGTGSWGEDLRQKKVFQLEWFRHSLGMTVRSLRNDGTI